MFAERTSQPHPLRIAVLGCAVFLLIHLLLRAQTGASSEERGKLQPDVWIAMLSRGVTEARHTKQQWRHVAAAMVGRGAKLSPDEMPPLLEYLATHFGRTAKTIFG